MPARTTQRTTRTKRAAPKRQAKPAAKAKSNGALYAIVRAGGRQWRVTPGTQLEVNRIEAKAGASYVVEPVLFARDGAAIKVGRPHVAGAKVVCEVLEHLKGPKLISFRFHRSANVRRKRGHRQPLTRLRVKEIALKS